tara:strand:+ start:694 stop:2124 length:1431 start_codon:yes stop_codon:yes gene_type:complete
MAKKGISYGADPTLVRGAAVAHKNWMVHPDVTAGLDKAIKAGAETLDYIKKSKEERDKIAKEKKEAEDKLRRQREVKWDKVADAVMLRSGGLGDNMYGYMTNKAQTLKDEYLNAVNNNDKKGEMDAFRALDAINSTVNSMKEFRATAAEQGISASMEQNGGKESMIFTDIMDDIPMITENEKGEITFEGMLETGEPYSITEQDFYSMYQPVNLKAKNDFSQAKMDFTKQKKFDRDGVEGRMEQVVPSKTKELRAFLSDPIENENWEQLISKDMSIAVEANDALAQMFDVNNKPGLQEEEIENLKNAITNPFHSIWNSNYPEGQPDPDAWANAVRPIVIKKLSNAIEQRHSNLFPPDEGVSGRQRTPMSEGAIYQLQERDKLAERTQAALKNTENIKVGGIIGNPGGRNIKVEKDGFGFYIGNKVVASIPAEDANLNQMILNHITNTDGVYKAEEVYRGPMSPQYKYPVKINTDFSS